MNFALICSWVVSALGVGALAAQTFAPPMQLEVDLPRPRSAADGALWSGDLDGDGKPDVLLVQHRRRRGEIAPQRYVAALCTRDAVAPRPLGPSREVRAGGAPLCLGQGAPVEIQLSTDGRVTPAPRGAQGAKGECAPRCADLDVDQRLDLVSDVLDLDFMRLDGGGSSSSRGPLQMFAGAGHLEFRGPVDVPGLRPADGPRPSATSGPVALPGEMSGWMRRPSLEPVDGIAFCDWNGDGRTDLVMQRAQALQVQIATSEGFRAGVPLVGPRGALHVDGEVDPWLVDLDRDGVLDLITLAADQSVTWRRGKRDAQHGAVFGAHVVLLPAPAAGMRRLAVVDWDGDGRADLLFTTNTPAELDRATGSRDARRALTLHWARQT